MGVFAESKIADTSKEKMEPDSLTQATDDSSPPSSRSERRNEPVGRQDIEVEMAMLMMQKLQREGGRQNQFPSIASTSSSMWSSSRGESEDSESYAWSTSLRSGSTDSSDFSSYSGSSDEESSSEEDEADEVGPLGYRKPLASSAKPGQKKYPQPPPGILTNSAGHKEYPQPPVGMMEGLPFGAGGFSLESLKKDLEKVGRAILSSNAGGMAAERAHTLASINWLASHVPNAVLDQLGHETRKLVEEEAAGDESDEGSRVASIVESDAMSDVSDLSQDQQNLDGFGVRETKMKGAKDKIADFDETEENLPGGIPALLSPRLSPNKKKKRSTLKQLLSKKGGLPLLDVEGDGEQEATRNGNDDDNVSLSLSSRSNVDNPERNTHEHHRIRGKRLPYSSDYRCALLFVDISGFTKLSTKLDPEALSKVRKRC